MLIENEGVKARKVKVFQTQNKQNETLSLT
jgi:hypothetical protein